MMRYIKIYLTCLRIAFSQAAAYRADFILGNIITLLSNTLFPLVTVVIYANGASFPEWSMWEVLLIQSVFSTSTGLSAMITSGVLWTTMDHIRDGSFEIVLLKPLSPLFYLTAVNFSTDSFGHFAGGLVLTIVSSVNTGAVTNGIPMFILLFIAGTAVLCGLNLIMAAISFKWVGNSRLPEIFDSINDFGKYPLGIFPKALQIIAAFVIPVAVVGFFPASALLGRLDPYMLLAVIPCAVFLAFGVWLYDRMIKRYEGVGG